MEHEVGLLIKDITFKVKRYDLKFDYFFDNYYASGEDAIIRMLGNYLIFQTQAIHYLLMQYRLRADKTDHAIF